MADLSIALSMGGDVDWEAMVYVTCEPEELDAKPACAAKGTICLWYEPVG